MTTLTVNARRSAGSGVHPAVAIAPLILASLVCLFVAAAQIASSPGSVLLVAVAVLAGGLLVRVLLSSPRLLLCGVLLVLAVAASPWFLLGIAALLLGGERR